MLNFLVFSFFFFLSETITSPRQFCGSGNRFYSVVRILLDWHVLSWSKRKEISLGYRLKRSRCNRFERLSRVASRRRVIKEFRKRVDQRDWGGWKSEKRFNAVLNLMVSIFNSKFSYRKHSTNQKCYFYLQHVLQHWHQKYDFSANSIKIKECRIRILSVPLYNEHDQFSREKNDLHNLEIVHEYISLFQIYYFSFKGATKPSTSRQF